VIPDALIYDPVTNPTGARCTVQDNTVNGLGIDPDTGFARRPYDNVGVQYGLKAFNAGQISAQQFIELNERVGGFDIDGNIVQSRSVADRETLRIAYSFGRANTGGGGLASVPIVDARSYTDKNPDIHDRIRSFSTRQRLIAANGHADNQVILITAGTGSILGDIAGDSPWQDLATEGVLQLEKWLDGIAADTSPARSKAEKVVRNKPSGLVDACYTADGQKIAEPASATSAGQCNQLYPPHGDPRIASGAPVANDIFKCSLRPVRAEDYAQPLTSEQLARLREIFPQGVCDYSKPGQEQREVVSTWFAYPLPGQAVRLDEDDCLDE
jgi:hypothetical protein